MSNNRTKVSIIIPVFNKSEFTDKCIGKIYQNTCNDFLFEIIIIDNNSTDNTSEIVTSWKERRDNLQYIRLKENLKFGYACNFGASNANGDVLIFLNNDTEPQKDWLKASVNRLLTDEKIGIVGSKLLYPDNTIQHCGIDFFNDVNPDHKIWPLHRYMHINSDDPIVNVAEEVPAVTGAALLIKKSLFLDVDKFDLNYKMYFEDTDLCFKVRAKGYKIFYEPKSIIIHHEGKSSTNQDEIDNLNKESGKRFYNKWKNEINKIEEEIEFIVERNNFYTVFNSEIFPQGYLIKKDDGSSEIDNELFKKFFLKLLLAGKAYYHFGGVGDALLLLSTFYENSPEQTIVSFANSIPALKSFFKAFPKLNHIYFLQIPEDPILNSYVRNLLPGFSNVLGNGVTPTDSYESEWNEEINIFKDYGVNKNPKWCKDFEAKNLEDFQVTIAPMGSNFGMFKSKRNIIDPDNWGKIIEFLTTQKIKPIIIGVPTEEESFPILSGCINKRSYSFEEQMGIISSSDIFIGADSWGKTFSALAGIPTIVFQPMYGNDLRNWKDNSDYVFLNPWDDITVVKNLDEFFSTFNKFKRESKVKKSNYNLITDNKSLLNEERKESPSNNYQVLWNAPIFDNSGYADESRNFIMGLNREGVNLKLNPITWSNSVAELPQQTKRVLEKSTHHSIDYSKFIFNISHIFPPHFKISNKLFNIGRTMFESDSLPTEWVDKCNQMDEIWVPSQFNLDSFSKAGVKSEKLFKIHESIDTELFSDASGKIDDIKSIKRFKFLSVFDWGYRKGWDVLIKAFVQEFKEEEASLVLKVWSSLGKTLDEIKREILNYLKNELKIYKIPSNIVFYDKMISVADFPKLYNSVNAYVSPNRGEGWGRPLMEAMAAGLPTIATNCTGQLEFMSDDNSFLIDCNLTKVHNKAVQEIHTMKGQNWFEPSLSHLQKLMREVFIYNDDVMLKAEKGKENIHENFNQRKIANQITSRLNSIWNEKYAKLNLSKTIVWEGGIDSKSSLSIVNDELLSIFILNYENLKILSAEKNEKFRGKIISEKQFFKNTTGIEIHIRHQFPPNLTPPKSGRWVIIQPWEFGSLPKEWVDVFSKDVDEMWVPSNYVREVYIESGIPKDRVFVIPNGFNPNKFNRNGEKYALKTKKKFKFLFVGGTIYRKGIDILLKAYTTHFKKSDDVCLVIKDMGGNSFYDRQTFTNQINEIINDKNAPDIEYIDEFLSEEELRGLYQTVDILVHPYRGEGFGLPILESMACGTSVIVTNGGAALDFCNAENSFLVDAEKTFYKEKKVGELETVNHPWLYEVSLDELKSKMKYVFENVLEVKEKGKKSFEYVHSNFTWENAVKKIGKRIEVLSQKQILRFSQNDLFTKHIEKAITNIEENEPMLAIENLEIAIANFANSERKGYENLVIDELIVILGNLYFASNNIEKAKESFEEALNENPNSSTACQGLGEIFIAVGDNEAAKAMLEWAVKNNENNSEAIKRLSEVNTFLDIPVDHNSLLIED